jgi:DNA polymerase III, delta subunit
MANTEQTYPPLVNMSPTQLWIGQQKGVVDYLYTFLQSIFCPQKGCQSCIICTQIVNKQHHAIRWVTKDKSYYSLESLEPLQHQLAYALADDEFFFFIFLEAETLSTICSNALLKSLEEPPRGYHFILITEYPHLILPTIRSRSVVFNFNNTGQGVTTAHAALFDHFSSKQLMPQQFLDYLEQSKVTEWESVQLVEELIRYWQGEYQRQCVTKLSPEAMQQSTALLNIFVATLDYLPGPGSAKIFWKNVYLCTSEQLF